MRALLRAAGGSVGLVVLLVGVPAALWTVAGWPLPRALPAPSEVSDAISAGYIPSRFWVGAAACVGWVAWAQLAVAVLVEAGSTLVRRETPRIFGVVGPARELARRLVGSLAMVGMLAAPRVAGAHTLPAPPPPATAAPLVVEAATTAPRDELRYVVQLWEETRDCLWNIAERYLGDGLRWREVYDLNRGRPQPNGASLREPELIYPGWVLVLPPDATGLPDQDVPTVEPIPSPSAPAVEAAPPASLPPPSATVPHQPVVPSEVAGRVAETPQTSVSTPANTADSSPGAATESAPTNVRGMPLVAALAVGLPVFAAGGVVVGLNRRRRRQVARHRPGRGVVRPEPALEPLERRLRALRAEEASAWVDAALRALTACLRERGELGTCEILCVRAGTMGLELLLSEPDPEAPEGFVAVDDGHVWRLDGRIDLDELVRRGDGHPPATPALVSLGNTAEGPLLANLEAFGVMCVDGDEARVSAFMAGAALELASAPWAEGVDLRAVGVLGALAETDGVAVLDDADELAAQLRGEVDSLWQEIGSYASAFAARTAPGAQDDWLPTVAVVATPGPGLEGLDPARMAGAGLAVVGRGPIPSATWRLTVLADGTGSLEPMGLAVRAAGVDVPMAVDLADLDGDAIEGATSLLATASDDAEVAPLFDLSDQVRLGKQEPAPAGEQAAVWVGVLGTVEVSGWAQPIRERRKLAEIVAYLATHPGRVGGERIRAAVWSDQEISDHAFIQAMSRLRRHLGSDEAGNRHLPEAVDRTYCLGSSVGCDWLCFCKLVAAAEAAAGTEAIQLYRQALGLVRGEPFANVAPGTYVWAYSEGLVYEMQMAVTKAADALAEKALAVGDAETAEWASRQGRLGTPSQLALFDWDLRAAHRRRDVEGLQRAFKARRQAEQALDPLAEVAPEAVELYEGLLADLSERRAPTEVGS